MENKVNESALVLVNKGMEGLIASMTLNNIGEYITQCSYLLDAVGNLHKAVVSLGITKDEFTTHASHAIQRMKESSVIKRIIWLDEKEWEIKLIDVCYEQMQKYEPNDFTSIDIDAIFALINKYAIEVSNGLPAYHSLVFLCVKNETNPSRGCSQLDSLNSILLNNIDKIDIERMDQFVFDMREWTERLASNQSMQSVRNGLIAFADSLQTELRAS